MRFHTQTAGSSLTAQQPENNIVRTAYQALSAVLGGTQSLHTNAFDEALGLPTDASAKLALRTQQVLGHETALADVVDPLAGSYYVESLTDELESSARDLISRIDELGGAVAAIEAGFQQGEIETAAYDYARQVDDGTATVVGVNKFYEEPAATEPLVIDDSVERTQRAALVDRRAQRDTADVTAGLEAVEEAARSVSNLLYPMKHALRAGATVGEVSDVLRRVFGRYRPAS